METVGTHRTTVRRQATAERRPRAPVRQLTAPAPATVKSIGLPSGLPNARRPRIPSRAVKAVLAAADLLTVAAALGAAQYVAKHTGGVPTKTQQESTWLLIGLSLPVWLLAFVRYRLYQARFLSRRSQELRRIVAASCVGTASLLLIPNVWRFISVQRDFVFYALIFTVGFLMVEREAVRHAFAHARRHGHRLRPVIIVGDNAEGRELRRMFEQNPSLGYDFVGFVNVERDVRHARPDEVLGHVDDVVDVVRRHNVRSVMIAASAIDVGMTNALVRGLLKAGVHTELSPTLPDIAVERLTMRPLGRFPVMYLEPFHQSGWRSWAKRLFDLLASFAALVVLALPLATLALLIKVDSRGPVFYRQRRVGKNGRLFDVVKFRTMIPNAHALRQELAALNEADGPLFKIRNDPRITRIGRFLRKTSLDELPQLWNVLRGEMSLVGPRPALPEEAELWAPELRDRLRVQPGITGMWQVSGRSNTSFDEYSRLDLYYVDNWSLIADLSIMAKTLPSVLLQRGAS
jgi:exopolysaccharide biosynthesis polyprenyl glycosylphosphotransferase